jgi:hypothetical protein
VFGSEDDPNVVKIPYYDDYHLLGDDAVWLL